MIDRISDTIVAPRSRRIPGTDMTIPVGLGKGEAFFYHPLLKVARAWTPRADFVEVLIVNDHDGDRFRLSREMRIHQVGIVIAAEHPKLDSGM